MTSQPPIWPSEAEQAEIERLTRIGWRSCYLIAGMGILCGLGLVALWFEALAVRHHLV